MKLKHIHTNSESFSYRIRSKTETDRHNIDYISIQTRFQ